tara:strand:+ start:658 stop:1059 length:402 start_codon:yes stop_codon:yes gene_type:complete
MKKTKIRSIHNAPVLTPCPIVLKDTIIKEVNNRLVDAKSGNYLIKLITIGDLYKTWIDYEYHSEVMVEITDLNNKNNTTGVTAPTFGPKPIVLNVKRKLHTGSFFTWDLFMDQLLEKCLRSQLTINNEGRYVK